jgi:UDP-glucose 4-epimerase
MLKRKILVTGGTGFIGSHTVCHLLEQGCEVISVDNLSNSFESVNHRIELISGKKPVFINADLCDEQETLRIFTENPGITGIIHFAAFKSVNESVQDPLKYYRNNLGSLTSILKAAVECRIESFVFSSSCTVYGQPEKLPVTEHTAVQKPSSPYGNTKKISEEILRDFCSVHPDFKVIALRYFNPIGAHPSGFIGELPVGVPNNLIPYLTQTAFGVRKELKVFGDDYHTPDGSAIRDYIHVVDLAEAHGLALEHLEKHSNIPSFDVFNLGTGKGYSVLEIVETFQKATGVAVPFSIADRRPGDVEKIWADPTKARIELGWKASRTLEEMLIDSWRWENYYRNTVHKEVL